MVSQICVVQRGVDQTRRCSRPARRHVGSAATDAPKRQLLNSGVRRLRASVHEGVLTWRWPWHSSAAVYAHRIDFALRTPRRLFKTAGSRGKARGELGAIASFLGSIVCAAAGVKSVEAGHGEAEYRISVAREFPGPQRDHAPPASCARSLAVAGLFYCTARRAKLCLRRGHPARRSPSIKRPVSLELPGFGCVVCRRRLGR